MRPLLDFLFTHLPWAYRHRGELWEIRELYVVILLEREEQQRDDTNVIKFPQRH
jgi:hypothetical protein